MRGEERGERGMEWSGNKRKDKRGKGDEDGENEMVEEAGQDYVKDLECICV